MGEYRFGLHSGEVSEYVFGLHYGHLTAVVDQIAGRHGAWHVKMCVRSPRCGPQSSQAPAKAAVLACGWGLV